MIVLGRFDARRVCRTAAGSAVFFGPGLASGAASARGASVGSDVRKGVAHLGHLKSVAGAALAATRSGALHLGYATNRVTRAALFAGICGEPPA
jgi:hypothetical protein